MRTLIGPLIYPDGTAMANAVITIRAARVNWSEAGLVGSSIEHLIVTNAAGQFAQAVAYGDYHVWVELPESNGWEKLGKIVVEAGDPIELGELIELSRDASADWSISADWATRAWVNAQILLGGVPYDVAITSLNPGSGAAGQLYRVAAGGLLLEAFTAQLKDWATGNGVPKGMLYEKADGTPGTLPTPRIVTGDTAALAGETLLVNMNTATGDIDITLPAGWALADPPLTIRVISDAYQLPYDINLIRSGAQTIMGVADDLRLRRRRTLVLWRADGNNVRFC